MGATIHPSALRHGVDEQDMHRALAHSLVMEDVGEDPDRWLVLGPDQAGNLLELVVLITHEGTAMLIHAMPMRHAYRRLLKP